MASLGLIMKRNRGTGFGNELYSTVVSINHLLANSFDVETNPGPANKFGPLFCFARKLSNGKTEESAATVVNSVSHRLSRNVKPND